MKAVAFDTETRGLDWWEPDQRAFLGSWADERGEYVAVLSDPEQCARFTQALLDADILIAHNLPFDTHQVRATLGIDLLSLGKELYDTDLMSRVVWPEGQRKDGSGRGGHGLKNLAQIHLDPDALAPEEHIEAMAKELKVKLRAKDGYYQVWRAYPEVMEHYAAMDARYTYDLWPMLLKRLHEDEHAANVWALEQSVMPWLIRAEARGVALDPVAVSELRQEYTELERQLREEVTGELGDIPITGEGSEAALLEALQMIGVPLHQRTDSGQLATNKYALQEFQDDFPVIAKLFEWRTASRFLNTYIAPMVDREYVHTSFSQIGAWTGRMSSRRPNMQNIPNRAGVQVRKVFVPREGYAFVVCDYDSIEARLIAWYTGSEEYRRKLAEGYDVHAEMAMHIYGGKQTDYLKGTPGQKERDVAKNTTYAICYGAGGQRVTNMNNLDPGRPLTEEDWVVQKGYKNVGEPSYLPAKRMINVIKANIPGFKKLEKRIRDKVERVGYVNTLWGRKQPVDPAKSYVGLNALVQGSAADIMKQGFVNTCEALEPIGGHVLLVVHDECVAEVPLDRAEEGLELMKRAMESAYPLDPPLAVTGAVVTTNYSEAK